MARLPRLVVPGHAHYLIQRGHSGRTIFADESDRRAYLDALREAAAAQKVAVHAWALADSEVHLLLTPPAADALARLMQAIGRRYVSAYHRRHGGSGTLWDGRFRAALVEPGATLLSALLLVDAAATATSAGHRTGESRDPLVVDPPEFWALGNTPFEREADYRTRLVQGLPEQQAQALRDAALGGWAQGSPGFIARLAEAVGRPLRPRARGRPRRT
ncbi:MAG: transposase [Burkholderiales bacterium]|nr:transposase [Burkholderiales bacterium]